jgi:hypothetical protein
MIATDHFVFVHLHTCGDRFANECLLRLMPGTARPIGPHLPWRMVPPSLARLPALGFVRNPWQYYALWYSLHAQRPRPGPIFRAVSENGTLDFEPTLRNLLDLGVSGARLNAVLSSLPPRFTGVGLNLPAFALEAIRDSRLGFFSFLHNHMYDGPGVVHIRPVERLRADLIQTLIALGQPVSSAIRAFVEDRDPAEAQAKDYIPLYSDSLRDLVAERDGVLIAKYAYRFDG